jgi:hypothetical protein
VRIGSNDGVGVEHVVSVHDNTSEVLEVDLMDDTRTGRDNLEVVEGLGSPLQELEALSVSLEFHLFVNSSRFSSARRVDLDGVVNNEIDRHEGVNLGGVSTESVHGVTHGSEIDDSRYTTIKYKIGYSTFLASYGMVGKILIIFFNLREVLEDNTGR